MKKDNFIESKNVSNRKYELRNVDSNSDESTDYVQNNYYKAYDLRYRQIYDYNMLWSSKDYTPDVINTIKKLRISQNDKILDLGCGEGRDSIYLLQNNYNVLAVDYSQNAINKCNELSNNKYINNFLQFDLIEDKMNEKFNFIYSVAVLHMFILEKHRNAYFKFINNHLMNNGKALICILGDGIKEYCSNIEDAFKDSERTVLNNMKYLNIASTSCKIVNWDNFEKEITKSGLIIEKQWISDTIPEFSKSMCVIISKNKRGK